MTAPMWYETFNGKWHNSLDGKLALCGCNVENVSGIVRFPTSRMPLCQRCLALFKTGEQDGNHAS